MPIVESESGAGAATSPSTAPCARDLEAGGVTLGAFRAAGGEAVADAGRIDPICGREPALVWWFRDPDGNPYGYDVEGGAPPVSLGPPSGTHRGF